MPNVNSVITKSRRNGSYKNHNAAQINNARQQNLTNTGRIINPEFVERRGNSYYNNEQETRNRSKHYNARQHSHSAHSANSAKTAPATPQTRNPRNPQNARNTSNSSAVAKKRGKTDHRYNILAFIIALLIIFAVLSFTMLFNARSIEVKGDSVYSDEEIAAAGNISLGVNLLRFDEKQAERDVMNALTLLDGAKVEKEYPTGILITATGAKKEFTVLDKGKYYDISETGRILKISDKRSANATDLLFEGCDLTAENSEILENSEDDLIKEGDYIACLDEEKIDLMFKITELTRENELTDIKGADISNKFDIIVYYGDGIVVKFESFSDLEGKFLIAKEMLSNYIGANEIGTLRIANTKQASFNPAPLAASIIEEPISGEPISEEPASGEPNSDEPRSDLDEPDLDEPA